MTKRKSDIYVRLPKSAARWIGIDELRKIEVDVRMIRTPSQQHKAGKFILDDLLRKTR